MYDVATQVGFPRIGLINGCQLVDFLVPRGETYQWIFRASGGLIFGWCSQVEWMLADSCGKSMGKAVNKVCNSLRAKTLRIRGSLGLKEAE